MKKLLPLLLVLLVMSCLGRRSDGGKAERNDEKTTAAPERIIIPEVPPMIVADEEKAEYLILHFWDNFDFSNKAYIDVPEITEQAFADYIAILGLVPRELAGRSLSALIERASGTKEMYDHFIELFEKYLDDPNSPFRNEELYIVVLEGIIGSDKVDDLDKIRPQAQLASAMKNRVGTKAANLILTDRAGRRLNLYNMDFEYTLLYFNNPDCNYCEEVTRQLKESTDMIVPLVNQKVLKILAVYPDEDLDAWREHLGDMPTDWYRTYDETLSIRKEQLYDLRAIPSLYLLSRDKTVLLKDIDKVYLLEQYFASQGY